MAHARHIATRKIAISQRNVIRFRRNLKFGTQQHITLYSRVTSVIFKFKMADGCYIENHFWR